MILYLIAFIKGLSLTHPINTNNYKTGGNCTIQLIIMKTYEVSYSGNSSRFDGFTSMVNAESKREAVEAVYQSVLDENYFPQEDGTIQDCTGYEIADATDTYIEYDGGYFSAELVLEKVQISHDVDGYPNATISENYESWFVDLGLGLGEAEYYKTDWTLEEAIEDQVNIYR